MGLYSSVEDFNTMPQEVKDEVINIMGAYSEVNVTREYGRLRVNTCCCISKYYAPDHKVWFFKKDELKKQYAPQIEEEEKRFYEESKNCNWELLND